MLLIIQRMGFSPDGHKLATRRILIASLARDL